jgi:Zn-dependent peptidase ImmA (M78 family)
VTVRRKHICNLAKQHLAKFSVNKAPVPVERIAESLGIRVCRSETDDDLSGFMYRDRHEGTAVIGVNCGHSKNRQRFTICHEIGHFILHNQEGVHIDRRFQLKLRNKTSSEGTDIEEQEANLFAAEMLMPESFLEEDIKTIDVVDLEDEEVIANLAKRYQVSTQAMTVRLSYLRYIDI